MLTFSIIDEREGNIRDRGYHFVGKNRMFDDVLIKKLTVLYGENMVDDLFDSFYDGWIRICKADDGKLYGVEFRYTDDGLVPVIWQEVERLMYFCITKWCKSITDSGKDEYTGSLKSLKDDLLEVYGEVPALYDFRLLDDDGVVYAYGKSTDCDSEAAFDPLDWYMYDYGCTEIQYKNPETGKYETL